MLFILQAMFHHFLIIFWFHFLLSSSLSLQSPTIPAFLEQSDVSSGCTLQFPEELFTGINDACAAGKTKPNSHELYRSRCCPVLAAWLYTAYSDTALGRVGRVPENTSDLPKLPDESETCVKNLEKGLKKQGMELVKPNETCDLVYCYCGITLHPLTCPDSFFVSPKTGKLMGDSSVKKLEKNCLSTDLNNGFVGLDGCSKCLNTLYLLNKGKTSNSSKSEERNNKMHSRDCELMGLTWLLAKNRTAYIHTVSAVLRAIMMSTDGSSPRSCCLNSDGMPLAVNSFEINSQPSSPYLMPQIYLFSTALLLSYIASLYTSQI